MIQFINKVNYNGFCVDYHYFAYNSFGEEGRGDMSGTRSNSWAIQFYNSKSICLKQVLFEIQTNELKQSELKVWEK